ncbi:MAG: type II toxin-antitoxin system VapC family toxin [Acidobacteria bacterium]|nr:MAG: type II toxin-antitoxin system VapC family toxin [Acidobacteriota bacterium]
MAASPTAYALDSLALLAYLEGEAGESRVRELLEAAKAGSHTVHLSLINLGEALYITERERGLVAVHRTLAAMDQLPVQIEPVERATVLAAAHLKASHRISYADAFAVVTALEHQAVLITGDPDFRTLSESNLVNLEWLPRTR